MPGANSLDDRQVTLDHDPSGPLAGELRAFLGSALGYDGEEPAGFRVPVSAPAGADACLTTVTSMFVVDPPIHDGADIGRLAICGTVNELAAYGAQPLWITLALVIEAGLPGHLLRRVAVSARDAAREAGVSIGSFDARVVRAGEADQVYICATGVGTFHHPRRRTSAVRPGDRILLSGRLGGHGAHLMSLREGLGFEPYLPSCCVPLAGMLAEVLELEGAVRCARPLARDGLAGVLRSSAQTLGLTLRVRENGPAVQHEARTTLRGLGLDPLFLPDEGTVCLFVAPEAVDRVLEVLRDHPYGRHAAEIGEVTPYAEPAVELWTEDGAHVPLDADRPHSHRPPRLR